MGSLFGGGGPSGPGPEYYASLKRQEENLAKQERILAQQERDERNKIEASKRAKRYGGFQLLLSPFREDAELGLGTTLSGVPEESAT
jgi:hypothetical protein|tara:strand:+ start:1081 stop:1341 length:261 start_codon:yes stop_codon:yes gene_type:complete